MEAEITDNTWVTSDTHFSHANIIKYCNRPFADVNEMNAALIHNWNQVVGVSDTVWFLGDFSFNLKKREIHTLFNALNGRKHLVIGNHDHKHTRKIPWESVNESVTLGVDDWEVFLTHYPIYDKFEKAVNLHGHSHGKSSNKGGRLDIGVDCTNYFPIKMNDAIEKAKRSVNVR